MGSWAGSTHRSGWSCTAETVFEHFRNPGLERPPQSVWRGTEPRTTPSGRCADRFGFATPKLCGARWCASIPGPGRKLPFPGSYLDLERGNPITPPPAWRERIGTLGSMVHRNGTRDTQAGARGLALAWAEEWRAVGPGWRCRSEFRLQAVRGMAFRLQPVRPPSHLKSELQTGKLPAAASGSRGTGNFSAL